MQTSYATYPFQGEDRLHTGKVARLPEYGIFRETEPTADQAMQKKFGGFMGAETVVVSPTQGEGKAVGIVGVDALTLDDLGVLKRAVDMEMLRLANLRSDSQQKREKVLALQTVRNYLAGYIDKVGRGEMTVEQIPIFPPNARVFLKVMPYSDTVPDLIDPNGNTPAKMRAALAPAPAPTVEPLPPALEEIKQGIFGLIKDLQWRVAADYQVEQNTHKRIVERLGEMERRVMNYSVMDTPMPEGYEKMFIEELHQLQALFSTQ
jgi:glutamate synthase domain-containing protein 3